MLVRSDRSYGMQKFLQKFRWGTKFCPTSKRENSMTLGSQCSAHSGHWFLSGPGKGDKSTTINALRVRVLGP